MPGIPAGEHADSVYADYARLNKLDDERQAQDRAKKDAEAYARERLADPFFNRTIVGRSKKKR